MNEAPADTPPSAAPSGGITPSRLEELCQRADDILWSGYRFALGAAGAPWPRLMLPQKGQERRVGEQEARLAFVTAVLAEAEASSWAFAAEVPTRLSYRFAQRGGSAKGPWLPCSAER